MRIRLTGTRAQCAAALGLLCEHLSVVKVAGPYRNRGSADQVRLYLTTTDTAKGDPT